MSLDDKELVKYLNAMEYKMLTKESTLKNGETLVYQDIYEVSSNMEEAISREIPDSWDWIINVPHGNWKTGSSFMISLRPDSIEKRYPWIRIVLELQAIDTQLTTNGTVLNVLHPFVRRTAIEYHDKDGIVGDGISLETFEVFKGTMAAVRLVMGAHRWVHRLSY